MWKKFLSFYCINTYNYNNYEWRFSSFQYIPTWNRISADVIIFVAEGVGRAHVALLIVRLIHDLNDPEKWNKIMWSLQTDNLSTLGKND